MQGSEHKPVAITIRKIKDVWFVALPDDARLGPYLNGDVALEVAVTHSLVAQKAGLHAGIFVEDEHGGIHNCMVIDWLNDPDRCLKCEDSWRTPTRSVRCPLRAAISGR